MQPKHTVYYHQLIKPAVTAGLVFACVLAVVPSGGPATLLAGPQGQPSISGAATNEVLRRQAVMQSAMKLVQAGTQAQSDRSYGEAMDHFKAAFEMLPEAPAIASTRNVIFRRYQAATVQYAQQMIDAAQWQEAENALAAAQKLGSEAGMPPSSLDPGVKQMLIRLNDPEYYTRAISPQHLERVEKVRGLLLLAQGHLDYGNYDQAIKAYNQVLAIDRYNTAARRGMENVERHKLNYFDVARDQTRATKLREIAQGWELPVPRSVSGGDLIGEGQSVDGGRIALKAKLKSIILPSLEFEEARLSDVLELLYQRSVELDLAETDPNKKGVNMILDTGSFGAGENPGDRTMSFRLSNIPLEDALEYVTRLTGTTFRVENHAVRILSISAGNQTVMDSRTWTVPPGFLSRKGLGNDVILDADPFRVDNPDMGVAGSVLVKRKSAREFLEENGITFPEGAVANYNPSTNTLLVRNTPDQLALIDDIVQTAREGVNKMVEIGIKMISVSQEEIKQKGFDWLLGASNLGATPRVFAGGGTDGTAVVPTQNIDFPFTNPGSNVPVGVFPVTQGLRTGDLKSTQSIDDVLTRTLGGTPTKAPAVFSVSGPFTDPQFQVALRMFAQMKGVDTLCDTKILVRPGQRGKLEAIRELIYPTEYDPPEIPNTFGFVPIGQNTLLQSPADIIPVTPATPTAFEMRGVGKTIEVEPTVGEDNLSVNLNILLDFTEFSGFIDYGVPITNSTTFFINAAGGFDGVQGQENKILMPVFDVVRETTNVQVWDGQSIAIGGFHGHTVTDSEDKIPYLGDLPAVGRLFRSNTENHVKRGIIIFARVRLVDPAGMPINQNEDEDLSLNEFPVPRSKPNTAAPTPVYAPPQVPYQK